MDVKPTLVRLAVGVLLRIDALCGPGKRAEFIREAVERELQRRSRGLSRSANSKPHKGA
jgi:hypothetical protein